MALQRLLIATACCVIPIALWLFLVGTVPAPTSLGSPHLRNRAEEDGGGTASTATHEQEHKPPELPQLGFAQRLAQQLLHQHAASVALPRHSSHPHPHQHQQQLHPHHVNPRMHHGNTTSTSASALRGAAAVAPASLGAKPAATSATLATSGAAAAAAATAASKTAATVLPPGASAPTRR
ncbi:hypothetical protein CHLRE_13g564426v5 [Chlamydomonas reinhardtii]|uniref:Uncharacterized protein n=1 Tax=Chlamydomonas reinhardtii TaxID=3055 RepID=A0A2K3CZ95_CHLRE|nr:uncharacterized protein CHLRE_13g564426v5 [Chlamydomonas reinhardtii]PNW73569.1 hypothetical protein CHLRE_13g564426v5 [Chlamydomonas reinhardtii]